MPAEISFWILADCISEPMHYWPLHWSVSWIIWCLDVFSFQSVFSIETFVFLFMIELYYHKVVLPILNLDISGFILFQSSFHLMNCRFYYCDSTYYSQAHINSAHIVFLIRVSNSSQDSQPLVPLWGSIVDCWMLCCN